MRLQPVEKPKRLMMRIAYFMARRRFGKVMTPMKVVLARMPGSERFSWHITKFELKKLHLPHDLHFMLGVFVSEINGCSFCADLGRSMVLRERMGLEKFNALKDYWISPLFSATERAALAYVEEATRNKKVSDKTFEELRKHFNDQEIVEITWINALENYYNLLNVPLEIESDGFCALMHAKTG